MKEPVILSDAIAEAIRQVIPLLILFGFVHWSGEQVAQFMVVVGVLITLVKTFVTRSQVTPVATANEQIQIGINSPKGTDVQDVVAAQKEGLNAVK